MSTFYVNQRADALLEAASLPLHHGIDRLKSAIAQRRAYNATMNELLSLSKRNLRDMGITQGDFDRIAKGDKK